ncbi:alcohol oxidase [Obba rivulosa]|uniref:Alcohol oxidase n=1 Tax=Obba rivulosa TaxID=1052685 RepID=A0A8E2J4N7_9APHY|nr:alcohol oxidase [Obba rivulosa]
MLVGLTDVANQSFDYIICGGGTAGLTLAARLTEDPHISVLVLEAGQANLDDAVILRTGSYGVHFGNSMYCWPFQTVKQKGLLDLESSWLRGKGLGGSSGINFLIWTKPPANEINDWEELGNPGWNWQNFQRYVSRVEGFVPPPAETQRKFGIKLDHWTLGREGPLKISYPGLINAGERTVQETLSNLGIEPAPLPMDGNPNGYFFAPNTIDPRTHTRSYATTAFYVPNKNRPNLTVLVSAIVSRIVTEHLSGGKLTATGVEFYHDEKPYVVHAKKEVIVTAGALKSPQILELSGIGNRDILEKIGIVPKVDLPGVGKNAQEHIICTMNFELRDDVDFETLDPMRDPEEAKKNIELLAQGQGLLTLGMTGIAFIPLRKVTARADEIIAQAKEKILRNADKYPPGLLEQYKIQLERLDNDAPLCEIISLPGALPSPNPPEPGKKYITLFAALNEVFSRGTIHSTSGDPMKEPEFDPHYFEEEVDEEIYFELVKFVRKVAQTAPLKDMIVAERNPGPECKTDEDLLKWAKTFLSTTWHTASSCSMLPKAKGGVVDHELKVYGTENIRVVDLSIAPLHFDAHTQATTYAIAEQAAAIITGKFPHA